MRACTTSDLPHPIMACCLARQHEQWQQNRISHRCPCSNQRLSSSLPISPPFSRYVLHDMSMMQLPSIFHLSIMTMSAYPNKSAVTFHSLHDHLTRSKYHCYGVTIRKTLMAPFKDQP